MIADPAEATGAYGGLELEARDILPPPIPRLGWLELADRVVWTLLGGLVALWVLVALGCGVAFAVARP